ncbi:MAG: methylenetetrahydrofolate reductase [NAD(P)H] [Lachnospiraceae bacterium]
MKINEMFKEDKNVFSFEVFPPKKDSPIEVVYDTLEQLSELKPDFISVTYRAAGDLSDTSTCDIASLIKNKYKVESVAHLTCVNSSKESVSHILEQFKKNNIENILALRGDLIPDKEPLKQFSYASDLVSFIMEHGDFGISGACYPEGHENSQTLVDDILNLKKKVDAGASHLITQLFFDNKVMYDFMEKIKLAGINVPVEAGIMPVCNVSQIKRMISMCGASVPAKLARIMQKYGDNPDDMREAGIEYATEQIIELLNRGVAGIHLYTMNNAYVARKISQNLKPYLKR